MIANTSNLLPFPKERIMRLRVPDGLSAEYVERSKINYLNSIVEHFSDQLIRALVAAGIDVVSGDFSKYFAAMIECLRAAVFRSGGIEHPLIGQMTAMIAEIENSVVQPNKEPK